MIRTTAKIIKVCFYGAVILAGVIFAVSNRGMVEFTFWPMPYAVSLPLFLFTIIVFALGLLTGWLVTHFNVFGYRRAHKQASKRVTALENELGAMRSEQMIRPATALPPK